MDGPKTLRDRGSRGTGHKAITGGALLLRLRVSGNAAG